MPILMWSEPVILVAPTPLLEHLQAVEIPRLQEWLQTKKPIETYSHNAAGRGLMLADPESWLAARLAGNSELHSNIPIIIDGVDDLEVWTRQQLTAGLAPADWNDLMQSQPLEADAILQARVLLTRAVFQHPAKPDECYLLETAEQNILKGLFESCLLYTSDAADE